MKISQQVENILKVSHAARNSDSELLIIYMQKSGLELTPKQIEKFKDLPSMETITRVRRQLQEQGKYEADEVIRYLIVRPDLKKIAKAEALKAEKAKKAAERGDRNDDSEEKDDSEE